MDNFESGAIGGVEGPYPRTLLICTEILLGKLSEYSTDNILASAQAVPGASCSPTGGGDGAVSLLVVIEGLLDNIEVSIWGGADVYLSCLLFGLWI